MESGPAPLGRGAIESGTMQSMMLSLKGIAMSKAVSLPVIILPRLISLAKTEVARQRRVFDEVSEEEWPADFDAHDIIMFEDVLEQLETAGTTHDETVEFPIWRGMQLLLRLAQKHGVAVVGESETAHVNASLTIVTR